MRLVSLNVHTENEQRGLVLKYLQNADADIILLMEVNADWMTALQPLRITHPQVIAEPRDDNFGMALFSRLPLTNSSVVEIGQAEVPSITTTIDLGGQQVFLLGTHPLPPGSAAYAGLRNEQLREIARLIRRSQLPALVAGDLNCTPWSPYFSDLLRESGLKNLAPACGLYGSWPAWLPLARIPIDHCLVSPLLQVVGKQFGPPVGSDHLPLVIDLAIPAATAGPEPEAATPRDTVPGTARPD